MIVKPSRTADYNRALQLVRKRAQVHAFSLNLDKRIRLCNWVNGGRAVGVVERLGMQM